jgi:hypothetical protein
MANIIPAGVYGLRVPAGGGPIPASTDLDVAVSFLHVRLRAGEREPFARNYTLLSPKSFELTATVPHHYGCHRPQCGTQH